MTMFLVTLLVFLLVVGAMSIGVIIAGKRIQGSCGGLGAAMTNDKGEKVCGYCGVTFDQDKETPCGKKSLS